MITLSIITVCYNSGSTIRDTIESVFGQTHPDIEYIIIDGASTDNTLEIVSEYRGRISKIVSEPDSGIYDAMNKGIALATGDVVGILNSDDFYADTHVLEDIADVFTNSNVDCVYGDLVYVDAKDINKILRYWKASPYKPGAFQRGWHPPHPSFFVRRTVYKNLGGFDTDIRLSADFDIMLRILEVYQSSYKYLPRLCVRMRTGGATSSTLRNIIIGNKNIIRAFGKYGIKINPFIYAAKRILPKVINRIMIKLGTPVAEI